jgi:phosphonate transport system substrate-binding protein
VLVRASIVMGSARRLLCTIGVAFCATQASAGGKPYEFGVFPYLPVTKIHEMYGPMAIDFGAKLGRQVQLSSKARYGTFGDELRREIYDIAFVQPFDYVDAHDKYGYLPLARRPGDLQALIVVRDDSPLETLKDLRGKTVANPPVDAAVSHLTSMALWEAGIDPNTGVRRDYGKNHFTCVQSVVIGAADACGVAEPAFRRVEEQTHTTTRLRILHKTGGMPWPLFVVHKRVSRKDREVLLKTIVEWSKTEEGKKILDRGQFMPFVAAKDADYEVVRRYIRSRK